MNWIARVEAIIRSNLRFSRISEKQKDEVVNDEIQRLMQEQEIGAPHVPEEGKTSRGERWEDLRKRAREDWEPLGLA